MYDDITALGQRFKEVRSTLGFTLKAMAAELDISYNYISDIERGKAKNPGPDIFINLHRKFNIDINWLFNGTGTMFMEPKIETPREFDFDDEIHHVSQITWLMQNSDYFKMAMVAEASRLLLREEDAIKKSIQIKKQKKEEKKEA